MLGLKIRTFIYALVLGFFEERKSAWAYELGVGALFMGRGRSRLFSCTTSSFLTMI